MSQQSDLLIDRKRLKQQLTGWRTLALLAVFGSAALLGGGTSERGKGFPSGDYIAEIAIEGVMVDDPKRDEIFAKVLEDRHAKAVILRLDSPGGTTVAGEEIFLKLNEIAKKKPVIGVMRTMCASACYMASLGANHVIAREGTLTGSIGVLLQSVEISRLADKLGISPVTIKSGPMKDVPDLAKPMTEEQRQIVSEVVTDAYDFFVRLIVKRRDMSEETVRTLADGRVYTGAQAAKHKLIDGIGGKDEALAWLAQNHKINPKLEIRLIAPKQEYRDLLDQLSQKTGIKIFGRSAMGLDGLVSIWHPSIL